MKVHILVTWTVDSDADILELGKTMTKEMFNAWNAGQPQMVITDQGNALAVSEVIINAPK